MMHFALALILSAHAASGMDLEGKDQILDPDMATEVELAKNSNLDNAMARGGQDAQKAYGHLRVLMLGSRFALQEALKDITGVVERKDLPARGTIEETANKARMSAAALGAQVSRVDEAALAAGLKVDVADSKELIDARVRYSADDRAGDLKQAEGYLREGRKKLKVSPMLSKPQAAFLAAVDAFAGELRLGRDAVKSLRDRLSAKHKKLGTTSYVELLDMRLEQLNRDLSDIINERRLTEIGMNMADLDEAAFDVPNK